MSKTQEARLQRLKKLGEKASKVFHKKSEALDLLGGGDGEFDLLADDNQTKGKPEREGNEKSKTYQCRLVVSIYAGASVHLSATMATFMDLYGKLKALLAINDKLPESLRIDGKDKWVKEQVKQLVTVHEATDKLLWDLPFRALETCVHVAQASETDELLELALIIADKGSSLFGPLSVRTIIEFVKATRDLKSVRSIRNRDIRTAAKVLAELEVFMTTSLVANEYAVACVHSCIWDLKDPSLSPEKRRKFLRKYSREFVVSKIREARSNLTSWVQFPKDGFWLDAGKF